MNMGDGPISAGASASRSDGEAADGPDFSELLAAGIVTAEADDGHAVHVIVEDLEPGRRVHYRVRYGCCLPLPGRRHRPRRPDRDPSHLDRVRR